MKLRLLITFLILLSTSFTFSQDVTVRSIPLTPRWSLKSNLLLDAATSFSLGFEVKTARRFTLDVPFSYNPWTYSDNKKWKHFLFQPELRYWICEPFYGHFLGIHTHYSYYNAGNLPFGNNMKNHRYEGWLLGAGFSYGYQWLLSSRWSIEASLGVGYAWMDYDKFQCERCGEKIKSDNRHYLGLTKAAVSLIYIIK